MLGEALIELLAYGGGYRGGLSNHLPMVAQALAELGAGEAECRRRTARRDHLEATPDDGRDIADTAGWLGDPASEGAWRRRLAWERARGEWARHWPGRLQLTLAAPASASFHGVIRLAYAVRGGTAPEVDAALTLPEEARLIIGDIEAALALPGLPERLPPGLLAGPREQRRYARLLFQARREFDALHLVTGWEAVLSLARGHGLADAPDSATLQMQAALLGIYLYNACPSLSLPALPVPAQEDEIRRLARAQADDHSVKLAASCLRLASLDDDAGRPPLAVSPGLPPRAYCTWAKASAT